MLKPSQVASFFARPYPCPCSYLVSICKLTNFFFVRFLFFSSFFFFFVRHLFNAFFNAVLVEFWLLLCLHFFYSVFFLFSTFNCKRAHPLHTPWKGIFFSYFHCLSFPAVFFAFMPLFFFFGWLLRLVRSLKNTQDACNVCKARRALKNICNYIFMKLT